jgi:glycerophosphoryl diester phosphodiesterase
VIGHRGAPDHAPENTLASFRRALADGADAVETDLWQTTDGVFVCHHDATLIRLTGDPRRVDELAWAELNELPVTGHFGAAFDAERVPALAELLALLPPDILLLVELKDPRFAEPAFARQLAEQVAARSAAFTIVAVSFHLDRLRALKSVAPEFPVGHITVSNPLPSQPTELVGPAWPLTILNPFYVYLAHRRGQLVGALDPTPERRLGWYLARGADAVLSNDPGATKRRLAELRGG